MFELLVVVVDDADPVGLAVGEVAGEVAPHPGPEEGRDPPGGRQVVLVDVVQHLVVQRDEVLDLRLGDTVLGGGDVGEGVADQHPAVLVLHPLEQLEDAVLHIGHEERLGRGRVALPATDLLEDELAEDGQRAVVQGVGHRPPLVVVEGPAGRVHPQLHHPPGQLGAQGRHLQELVVVLKELPQEVDVLAEGGVALLVGAGHHDLAVVGDLEGQPGHLVAVLGASQLVHRVQEDEEGPLAGGQLEELLEEGGDRDSVLRDVLKGQDVGI